MHQFFVEQHQIGKEYVTITGSDVNHIRNVLRMKPGEKIRVSDQQGEDYFCEIAEIGEDFVQADIVSQDQAGTELPSKLYLPVPVSVSGAAEGRPDGDSHRKGGRAWRV